MLGVLAPTTYNYQHPLFQQCPESGNKVTGRTGGGGGGAGGKAFGMADLCKAAISLTYPPAGRS